MDNDAMQEHDGEAAAEIRAALYKACPDMPSYPVGIMEPHLAALHKNAYDQGYYDGFTNLLEQHEAMREALEFIAVFADVRSKDDSKTFAKVNRGALRTIAEKANAALDAALEQSK